MNKSNILGRNLHPHQVRIISPLPPAIPYWEPPAFVEVPECCTVFDDRIRDILLPVRSHFSRQPLDNQISLFEGEL